MGTTSVPAGFVRDGAWGIRPTLPAAKCTGATRAKLGSATCQPIDDCTVSFPPPAATIVVRADLTPYASRPDVTVVATLDEAITKVGANGTIAIDEGEYATPASLSKSVTVVGRCASRTSLKGDGFGIHTTSAITASFSSIGFTGAPMVAFLIDAHAKVTLDRVWIHGDGNGADVGNSSTLTIHRSVIEGPPSAQNPNAATNGVEAFFGGQIALTDSEVRGFQNAVYAQSVHSSIAITGSVVHEETSLGAEKESLAVLAAFLGAKITVDGSHIESSPGRVALIGSKLLNGGKDPTSPGNPPAQLLVQSSTLLQSVIPREASSVIDVVDGASLTLENASLHHDSFVGIGASDSSKVTISHSLVSAEPSTANARTALSGTTGATFVVDSTAMIGSTGSALLLDASTASLTASLISGNREFELHDPTVFLGSAQALGIANGGSATLLDTAFTDNEGTAFFVQGGTAKLENVLLSGTHASKVGVRGTALLAVDSAVLIRTSNLYKNDLGLGIRGGRALLRDSTVGLQAEVARLDGVTFEQTTDPVDDAVDQKLVAARSTFAQNSVMVSPKSLTAE